MNADVVVIGMGPGGEEVEKTADVLASANGHARRVEIEPTMKSFREKVTI